MANASAKLIFHLLRYAWTCYLRCTHPVSTVTHYQRSFMEMLGNKTQARLAETLIVVAFLVCAGTMTLTSALTTQRQPRVVPEQQLGQRYRTLVVVTVFSTATRQMGDR